MNDEQVVTGGVYVHDWERTGEPPVQPDGDEEMIVRVCVLSGWQAPHVVYVKAVQFVTGGV
ncbi:MAG TPA: hypothetical protein VM753_13860 [Anaeromyxobacter sp.]|nr:hypothetical protein [Anaeromyxobacter sp.]